MDCGTCVERPRPQRVDANYTMEPMRLIGVSIGPSEAPTPAGSYTEIVAPVTNRRRLRSAASWLSRFCSIWLASALTAGAHEIPTDVVVQSYVKPDAQNVTLLLRVPLEAMRDVDLPLRGAAYVDIPASEPFLEDAAEIWLANFIAVYADGERLENFGIDGVRLALPSDRSFASYEEALAAIVDDPLSANTDVSVNQALLDVVIRYPVRAAAEDFAIDPQFGRLGLRTTTVVNFIPTDGVRRVFEFSGSPGLVRLDPRWHQAFFRFVVSGVEHILIGIDHILFLLCLIIPFRRLKPLIVIVTSFTVAHSITLLASAFGLAPKALWFPPLIETLIALSIVYMAIENIIGARWERRWLIAFGFGLVHGFGFSFALSETLQFAGAHLVTSLLAFNIGVELGQLLLIAVAVPLLNLFFKRTVAERTGTVVLSALLAHSGWHWMSDRAAEFAAYDLSFPALDAAFAASILRWLMLLLVIALSVWALLNLHRRLSVSGTDAGSAPSQPL